MSCEPLVNLYLNNCENDTTPTSPSIISGLIETSSSDTASENSPTSKAITTSMNLNVSCDSIDIDLNTSGNLEQENEQDNLPNRRVSFPKCDSQLVTGCLEPANPWESALLVTNISELRDIYLSSCRKHNTNPLEYVLNHLQAIDLNKKNRHGSFSLKHHLLSPNDCETLEEIFKRVQYETLDFSFCGLNEASAPALFDIIEYYEAANELDISDNSAISFHGWQSCIVMIKKSYALQILTARGNPMTEINATNLSKSLNQSSLHTIKLERCGLKGKPLNCLCIGLKKNSTLKELWLACNDLTEKDAEVLADLLRFNGYIQFLDISNNNIQDFGLKKIAIALIEQSLNLDLFLPEEIKKEDIDIKSSAATTYPNINHVPAIETDDNDDTSPNNKNSGRSMLDTLLNIQQKTDLDDNSLNDNTQQSLRAIIEKPFNSSIETSNGLEISDLQQQKLTKDTKFSNLNISPNTTNLPTHVASEAVDVNKNNSLIEFELESSDSAFESSSEGDKKVSNMVINANNINNTIKPIVESSIGEEIEKKIDSPKQFPYLPTRSNVEDCKSAAISENRSNTHNHLRSHSSDSLSSENSLDGCEITNFSKDLRAQLAKNDTLTRQKTNLETEINTNVKPRGLRALVLWNNHITRESGEVISDLLKTSNTLELLNIGKNCLSNEFIDKIKDSLRKNSTLTNLGLQAAHLSCDGIKSLATSLQFGGNCTLQRIDIRENHIQEDCLNVLNDALKSNKSVTRIDIDDIPKRISDPGSDLQFHYSRALQNVRSLCSRNEKHQQEILSDSVTSTNKKCENPKLRQGYFNSRKISLTCQSITNPTNILENNQRTSSSGGSNNGASSNHSNNKLDIKRKSGIRLRSPLPSPPTVSPSTSPVPSPSKSRFQVFRVNEDNAFFSTNSNNNNNTLPSVSKLSKMPNSITAPNITRKSRFRVTKVESDQINLNYHSLDTSNNDALSQNILKSKSLPNFTLTPTNLVVTKDNENSIEKVCTNDNVELSNDKSNPTNLNTIHENESCMKKVTAGGIALPEGIISEIDYKNDNIQNINEISNNLKQNIENDDNKTANNQIFTNNDDNFQLSENDETKTLTAAENQIQEKIQLNDNDNNNKLNVSATYPSTVDKLLSLFQNPVELFSRVSVANDSKILTTISTTTFPISEKITTTTNTLEDEKNNTNQTLVPLKKNSPPNLFPWYKFKSESKNTNDFNQLTDKISLNTVQSHPKFPISTDSNLTGATSTSATATNVTESVMKTSTFFDAASKQFKDFADFGKQIIKHNVNFIATAAGTGALNPQKSISPPNFSNANIDVVIPTISVTTTTTTSSIAIDTVKSLSSNTPINALEESTVENSEETKEKIHFP